MHQGNSSNEKIYKITLSFFWVLLMVLGNQVVPIPALILYPLFGCVFLYLWVSRTAIKRYPTKASTLRIEYWALSAALIFATGLVVSVFVTGYQLGPNDNQTLFALGLSLALVSRVGTANALKGFYTGGSFFLIAGWVPELLNRIPVFYPSGFSINPLGHRWSGLYSHPNAAGFCAAIICALGLLAYNRKWMAAISFITLLLTENRGGAIALAVVIAGSIIRDWRNTGKLKKIAAILLSGAVLVLSPLFFSIRDGASDTTTGRGPIWDYCLSAINDKNPFGHGPLFVLRTLGLSQVEWLRPQHCHNQLLDDVTNYGLITGAIPFLILFVVLVMAFRKGNLALVSVVGIAFIEGFWEPELRLFTPQGYLWSNLLLLSAMFLSADLLRQDLPSRKEAMPATEAPVAKRSASS